MATNEILQFAETDTGTNLLTQAEYLADAQRPIGNQPGVARSKLVNKALRQSSLIAAAVAQFIADNQANNVADTASPNDIADWIEAAVRSIGIPTATAGGTADAITADFTPNVALTNGATVIVRAGAANATTTPTFAPDGLIAKTIVKGNNLALVAGDIAGAGHWLEMQFDSTLDKWVLQNPATGVKTNFGHGQCYLALSGGNLVLSPRNGNKLMIAGVSQSVPSGGVSLAATGLTPGTTYFIYAYMNGATMTLEASTTGHSTDATTGVEIKTGDATRTLVGQAYCTTGPAWVDSGTLIGVLSYFNRAMKVAANYFTANRATSSLNVGVEINSEIRVSFLNWADTKFQAALNGTTFNSGAAYGATYIGIDGTSTGDTGGMTYNTDPSMVAANYTAVVSEGALHYSTLCGFVLQASTQTWFGNAAQAGGQRCSNRVLVWG